MSNDDKVVCPECGQINPIECSRVSCPLENYFWELDEGPDE